MHTKTINYKNILALFLCLFISNSYCSSKPVRAWRTLALIGFGAGLGQAGSIWIR